jgi:sugar phosphate isomerase/epimerase
MSLRRCFSTLGCPELPLDAALALAAKHGLDGIEVRALGGTLDVAGYLAAAYGTPAALADRMRDSTLGVVAFNASLHLGGVTDTEREQLVGLAPWAHALGVKWLRVFDGGKQADAGELARARETVEWWREVRVREAWSPDIMVETHDSLFTSERIQRFVAGVPGVAILWDAHHTWRKGGEDPAVTWAAIRANVVHVHVKDSIDVPGARHPFTYVLPGDGQFPIRSVLDALRAEAFGGPVSLEWEKLWHPSLPSLDEALAMAETRRWW